MSESYRNLLRLGKWRLVVLAVFIAVLAIGRLGTSREFVAAGPAERQEQPTFFRIGEKLSYRVSFGKFATAAYAETFVASRGKLSGRDAVEIRAKVKTLEMVSAAFFQVDESRTVYAAPDTGLPLYISSNSNNTILPQEKISNFLTQPTSSYELVTALFKARESGGAGTFPILEGDQISTVTFVPTTAERVRTDAGDFDTIVSTVQSAVLAAAGMTEVRVNFTTDEFRVPVQIRFKTDKGLFRALITGITLPEPQAPVESPTPTPTPTPAATPKTIPTPEEVPDNRPLSPELGFQIGEALEYGVTSAGKPVARVTFRVQERKLFEGNDNVLLTATVTAAEQGNGIFTVSDSAKVQVDPETLTPNWAEMKFTLPVQGLKQTITFDKRTGEVKFGEPKGVDSPIGTHNLLSLFYAMRSFNLRPSKTPSNPVNDTRVAVFWEDKTYVFTLRPSIAQEITVNGEKMSAQLVSINTQNPQLDALSLKVWLRTEDRVPVRISAGTYQADLISIRNSRLRP